MMSNAELDTLAATPALKPIFEQIAAQHADIETLDVRGRDHLDFHDVGVVGLGRMLAAAYKLGMNVGQGRGPVF